MGLDDKVEAAAQDATGKAKETAGKAGDDTSLQAEGHKDQAVADARKTGEDVKDSFTN